MRRTILLCLSVLLAVSVASDACAQRRGGGGSGFARSGSGFARSGSGFARAGSGFAHRGNGFSRSRGASHRGYGYPYLPYDAGDAFGDASQPVPFDQGPATVQPPAAPAPPAGVTGHAVILEYNWPAAGTASAPSTTPVSEPQNFAIVLKDGSSLTAVTVFVSDDGLHYVDPDEKHLLVAMSSIDRAATLKTNRARNLNLYLPFIQ